MKQPNLTAEYKDKTVHKGTGQDDDKKQRVGVVVAPAPNTSLSPVDKPPSVPAPGGEIASATKDQVTGWDDGLGRIILCGHVRAPIGPPAVTGVRTPRRPQPRAHALKPDDSRRWHRWRCGRGRRYSGRGRGGLWCDAANFSESFEIEGRYLVSRWGQKW